jgi:nicotinamide-nucleotide amidase
VLELPAMANLEVEIAALVRKCRTRDGRALTIGAAESATGGRVADRLTAVAGSSDYFRGSLVAYSNEVKISVLGVRRATIESHGAVSAQTALEMAQGGRELLGVDICISDTGIAGPGGGTPEKPAGLFYLGLATEDAARTEVHVFTGDREQNKRQATEAALSMLRSYLQGYLSTSKGAV